LAPSTARFLKAPSPACNSLKNGANFQTSEPSKLEKGRFHPKKYRKTCDFMGFILDLNQTNCDFMGFILQPWVCWDDDLADFMGTPLLGID
jgi:hypothetical protein